MKNAEHLVHSFCSGSSVFDRFLGRCVKDGNVIVMKCLCRGVWQRVVCQRESGSAMQF